MAGSAYTPLLADCALTAGAQLTSCTVVTTRRVAQRSVVVEANLFGRFFRVIQSYGNALGEL